MTLAQITMSVTMYVQEEFCKMIVIAIKHLTFSELNVKYIYMIY